MLYVKKMIKSLSKKENNKIIYQQAQFLVSAISTRTCAKKYACNKSCKQY